MKLKGWVIVDTDGTFHSEGSGDLFFTEEESARATAGVDEDVRPATLIIEGPKRKGR